MNKKKKSNLTMISNRLLEIDNTNLFLQNASQEFLSDQEAFKYKLKQKIYPKN